MTSSNGNIFRVNVPLCGEFTGPGEFPAQRPVTRSFGVFLDLCLNKWLRKQPRGWWFETPSWSLWRQCNVFPSTKIHNSLGEFGKWSKTTSTPQYDVRSARISSNGQVKSALLHSIYISGSHSWVNDIKCVLYKRPWLSFSNRDYLNYHLGYYISNFSHINYAILLLIHILNSTED